MGRVVQRDAAAWRAIVQRQLESGLSQMALCAAEGLLVSSLQNWKRKFVREGRIAQALSYPVALSPMPERAATSMFRRAPSSTVARPAPLTNSGVVG